MTRKPLFAHGTATLQTLRAASVAQRLSKVSWLFVALLFLLSSGQLLAQFDSGAVLGNIKDPSGAVVPTATVELLSVDKGTKVARQTDASGGYEFDSVQPGDYKINRHGQRLRVLQDGQLQGQRRGTAASRPRAEARRGQRHRHRLGRSHTA